MKIKNEQGEILKAGSIIMNDEGKILLLTTPNRDIWSFPKGHMEAGETIEQATRREVLEETGYEINIARQLSDIIYTDENTGEPIRIFIALSTIAKKVNDGEEGIIKGWFTAEEAEKKLFPNLIFLLKEI